MLLLQLLLRLENMMIALLMMRGLQKLIQGNPMKVRMTTLILPKMVIVVMLLLRLVMLLLLMQVFLMFVMSLMFLMVLRQMPLFLILMFLMFLMFLMTLTVLQWHYLRGRWRNNFSKFEKNLILGRGLGMVLRASILMHLINAGVGALFQLCAFKEGGGGL